MVRDIDGKPFPVRHAATDTPASAVAEPAKPEAWIKEWDNMGDTGDRRKCVDFDANLGSHMKNARVTPLYAAPPPIARSAADGHTVARYLRYMAEVEDHDNEAKSWLQWCADQAEARSAPLNQTPIAYRYKRFEDAAWSPWFATEQANEEYKSAIDGCWLIQYAYPPAGGIRMTDTPPIARSAADEAIDPPMVQLSEMLRGLEIGPEAATWPASMLYSLCQKIAAQAKSAAPAGSQQSGSGEATVSDAMKKLSAKWRESSQNSGWETRFTWFADQLEQALALTTQKSPAASEESK